jgi:fructokinase
LILAIGEILMDVFPQYARLGGAPFNYSFHLKKMGKPVVFVSRIGKDEDGKRILKFLKNHGFETKFIQIDKAHQTGRVLVELDENGHAEFNILKDAAYDYIRFNSTIGSLLSAPVDIIYFGTVIQRTKKGFDMLKRVLSSKRPETKCFCDINLRPGCYDKAIVLSSLEHADILKLSHTEVTIIKQMIGPLGDDSEVIQQWMKNYDIEMVALTLGASGSALYLKHGDYEIRIPKTEKVVDTVGAGDAYAAMLTTGCLCGWHPARILSTASNFASRICSISGAIPTSEEFYDDFIKDVCTKEDRHEG